MITQLHPLRRPLNELRPGAQFRSGFREISGKDITAFADLTGDRFHAHLQKPVDHLLFRTRVAHGQLIVALAYGLLVPPDPGPLLANLGCEGLRFHRPVAPGTFIRAALTCTEILPRAKRPYGEAHWSITVEDRSENMIADFDLLTLMANRWPLEDAA